MSLPESRRDSEVEGFRLGGPTADLRRDSEDFFSVQQQLKVST